jgi:hypothetical protein
LPLDPWRYVVDAEPYRRRQRLIGTDDWVLDRKGPIFRETVAKIRSATVQPRGPLGVFAFQPNTAFDHVVANATGLGYRWRHNTVIVALDRITGSVHAWTTQGKKTEISLPPEANFALMGSGTGWGYPLLVSSDRIYFVKSLNLKAPRFGVTSNQWTSLASQHGKILRVAHNFRFLLTVENSGNAFGLYQVQQDESKDQRNYKITPQSVHAVAEFLPEVLSPIECMLPERETSAFLVVARTSGGRDIFRIEWQPSGSRTVEHVELPPGSLNLEVTSCTASTWYLYLAFSNGTIRKFFRVSLGGRPTYSAVPEWKGGVASVAGPVRPTHFTGLMVSDLEQHWEVLYAVAGNGAIYRFTADGIADQRIELDFSPARK